MTNTKQPAGKKRAEGGAGQAENPFRDAEFYSRMRDYTEREAAVAKELRAIVERGAGKKRSDPRFSSSLKPLLGMVKKGLLFSDMLERIAAGTEKGLWEGWLTAFGFELRGVNYDKVGARNARLALDIGAGAKANAAFANAGVPNWRSLVAEDCFTLQMEKADAKNQPKAYAIFILDPAPK